MTSPSPSSTTVARKRCKTPSKEALNPSFSDLPSSLVEVIMSHLALKDNIRASAVCKSWREAAIAVRVVAKHPWLMRFHRHGTGVTLFDPLQWKFHTLNLPELASSNVCYSRDGWLLMRRYISNDIFFFHPFSRKLVSLPKLELSFQSVAFSCPPTSDNCVLVALDYVTAAQGKRIIISTCHPGASEWIAEDFPTILPFYKLSKLVYLNGRFYCFTTGGGYLYSFHSSSRSWICHDAYVYYSQREWYKKECFLAEKKGELFLMLACGNEKPLVYKLVSLQWEEMSSTELDGSTIFFGFHSSELRTNLPWMGSNLCYSTLSDNRKGRISYSFDERRHSPHKKRQNLKEFCAPQCVWIDMPENVLDYL